MGGDWQPNGGGIDMSTQPGGLLDRLARSNPTAVFLGALVIVLLGLFLPGALGGLMLLALAVGLAALMRMTWALQPPAARRLRLVVLALIVAVALTKII
jgi:hypothetical protein